MQVAWGPCFTRQADCVPTASPKEFAHYSWWKPSHEWMMKSQKSQQDPGPTSKATACLQSSKPSVWGFTDFLCSEFSGRAGSIVRWVLGLLFAMAAPPAGRRAKKALIRTWAEQMSNIKCPVDLIPRFKQELSHRLEGDESTLPKHLKNQKLEWWNCLYCSFCGWESSKPIKFMKTFGICNVQFNHSGCLKIRDLRTHSFPAKIGTEF